MRATGCTFAKCSRFVVPSRSPSSFALLTSPPRSYVREMPDIVVPSDAALCLAQFPRSYVREMLHILQRRSKFLKNRLCLLNQSFTYHLHMQASDVAVNN
jgi:hypothetical protein